MCLYIGCIGIKITVLQKYFIVLWIPKRSLLCTCCPVALVWSQREASLGRMLERCGAIFVCPRVVLRLQSSCRWKGRVLVTLCTHVLVSGLSDRAHSLGLVQLNDCAQGAGY